VAAKRRKKRKIFSPIYLTLVLILLYLPILMVIIYSFNAGRTAGAWQGFSTQWYTRLFKNGLMADALVNSLVLAGLSSLIAGGVGTLDEFYQILTLRVLHRHEKPIILYNIDGFWNSTLAVIKEGVDKGFISPEALEDFVLCDTPKEVFDILEK
jgi:ABC-type spermidine/putrescine transport system permease subunit I